MYTYDRRTVDSAGAFLVGELERLDPTLNLPLTSVTWQRDIDLRDDVTMGDESASFTVSSLAAPGSGGSGINWISATSTAISGISLDIKKNPQPLDLWGMELSWSIPELANAQKAGRPVETQKYEGLKTKHQMDADQLVYVGDTTIGSCGLINNPSIAPFSLTCDWTTASPEDILKDVNAFITHAWGRTGSTVCPDQMRVPPKVFGGLCRLVSQAGSMTILEYISKMCVAAAINGRPLTVHPLKWLSDAGVTGHGRIVLYTRDKKYVRFPMVPLQKTPLEARGIFQLTTYFNKFGRVEFVYPETVTYGDIT